MSDVVPESASLTRLRDAWNASSHVPPGEMCLSAEWVWDAVIGRQSGVALEAGLAHVTQCAACAEAWRVAHELLMATGQLPAVARPTTAWPSWRVWVPAAAAVAVLFVGAGADRGWFDRATTGPGDADVIRGASPALTANLPEGAVCERAACRLSWSDAGDGARYTVRVTTGDLAPVAVATGLAEPAFTIPASDLQALAPQADVLWQVEAVLPDGRRLSSATFSIVVR